MSISYKKFRLPPWERSKGLSSVLKPLGWLYGAGMEIRNRLYDWGLFKSHFLPIPVISIGNLAVGGTGKTPLTIEITKGLLKRNPDLKLGILSRGYRRKTTDRWIVSDGKEILMGVAESGDEPRLIARSLPGVKVFVGADRVAVAKKALARFDLDLLILDDAFQHRRIHRDVDILLVDAETGLGGGRVLPSGPLREFPWNVKRATCLVVSRFNERIHPDIRRFCPPEIPIFKVRMAVSGIQDAMSGEVVPLEEIRNKDVWGVCGIARPASFLKSLEILKLRLAGFSAFPDHHDYTERDFQGILQEAGEEAPVVTTEKDWVKWEGRHPFRKVYVVPAHLEFIEGEEIYDFIEPFVYNKRKGVEGGVI